MNEAATLVWLSAMWVMLSDQPNQVYIGNPSYYGQLMQQCESRAGRACCRASVRAMRRASGTPTTIQEGCSKGEQMVSLSCPASGVWCEGANDTKRIWELAREKAQ